MSSLAPAIARRFSRPLIAVLASATLVAAAAVAAPPASAATGPSLSLRVKASLQDVNRDGRANLGETVSFVYTVTNTGNEYLTWVDVVAPQQSGTATYPLTYLGPGGSGDFSWSSPRKVTVADVRAGALVDTARGKANTVDDETGNVFGPEVYSRAVTTRVATR